MELLTVSLNRKSCDAVDVIGQNGILYYVELFGNTQIIKSISSQIIMSSNGYVQIGNHNFLLGITKWRRHIEVLEDGNCICIMYSERIEDEGMIFYESHIEHISIIKEFLKRIAIPIPSIVMDSVAKKVSELFVSENIKSFSEKLGIISFHWQLFKNDFRELAEIVEEEYSKTMKEVS